MKRVALLMLVLSGCALGRHAIDGREAHRLVGLGAVLLDVRSPEEFAAGHLEGAINIPVQQLEARTGELSQARAVVVYCHSGLRAARAAGILEAAGVKSIANLGPMSAW